MENNKNKKSVTFQGDMLNFYDFIQVFVFITNHHLKVLLNNDVSGHICIILNCPCLIDNQSICSVLFWFTKLSKYVILIHQTDTCKVCFKHNVIHVFKCHLPLRVVLAHDLNHHQGHVLTEIVIKGYKSPFIS